MSLKKSKKNLIAGFLISAALKSHAQTGESEVNLEKLNRFFSQFSNGQRSAMLLRQSEKSESFSIVNNPSVDRSTWEAIANQLQAPDPETAFKMARHAFLLELDQPTLRAWIDKIPVSASEWFAKGQYLLGAYETKQNRLTQAKEYFSTASRAASKDSAVSKLSTMALARISFHEGDFNRAEELYSQLMGKPLYDESALHELSWAHFNQGETSLSYTDIYLLFSLYPDSDELFHTSNLLSKIYEKKSNLDEGSDTLEKLSLRFNIEQENTARAFRAYKDVEQELLLELDPSITYSPARSILPTMARKKLKENATVKNFLSQLLELDQDRTDMERGLQWVNKTEELWKARPEISLDSLAVLSWANTLEREVLHLGLFEEPDQVSSIKLLMQDIENARIELQDVETSLLSIDEYLSSQWLILSGERAAIALLAKQNLRKQLERIKKLKEESSAKKLELEFTLLQTKYDFQKADKVYLTSKRRNLDESQQKDLARLDEMRDSAENLSTQAHEDWLSKKPELAKSMQNLLASIEKARKNTMAQAQRKIAAILPTVQEDIRNNLNEYEWSIAEARYKLFKGFDAKTSQAKAISSQQETKLSETYETILKNLPIPASRDPSLLRDENVKAYAQAAKEFVEDVSQQVLASKQGGEDFSKDFRELQEKKWQDSRDIFREKAIVAFQRYTKDSTDKKRTPYALFRLAQLFIDRTRKSGVNPQEENLALAPLERIRKEFPEYLFMDRALYLLGTIYAKQGDYQRSQDTFLQTVKEYPASPLVSEIELRIAENFFNDRDLPKAREHYAAVMKSGSEDLKSKALYKTAWCHYLEKNYDQAIRSFTKLLELAKSPDPETQKLYSDYTDEASEYIAFGLYRQKQTLAPSEILALVSVQPYTERIFMKTAEIYKDRGELKNSVQMYDLLLEKFESSTSTVQILEKKVQALENSGDNLSIINAKKQAIVLLAPGSAWRKANRTQYVPLKRADELASSYMLDLAVDYEQAQPASRSAISTYQQLVDTYPQEKGAYDARFRLGELSYLEKNYMGAALQFDMVVRNEKYGHHFDGALYNIVSCREAELPLHKEPMKEKAAIDEFAHSVDNLVTRAPNHPKAAESYFRTAQVYEQHGDIDEAVKRYQTVAERYPASPLKEPALTAAIQARMEKKQWAQSQALADQLLKDNPTMSENTKKLILEAKTNSAFSLADSPKAFLDFQANFPDSELSSKAVFNAILLSRKSGDRESEEKALQILLTKYENSPEARTAHLEKAVLFDSIYEVDQAIEEYEKALASQGLNAKQKEQTYAALAKLISISQSRTDKVAQLTELSKKVKQPLSSEILLLAKDDTGILEKIAKSDAPAKNKALAHAMLSSFSWERGKEADALKNLSMAQKYFAKTPPDEAIFVVDEVANASFQRALFIKKQFNSTKLVAKNPQVLAKSFQKKAGLLGQMEKATLTVLQYPSAFVQINALDRLAKTYQEFSKEMMEIELPSEIVKSERDKFRANMSNLSAPLLEKANQAMVKSREISRQTKVAFADKRNKALWVNLMMPSPPAPLGYDRDSTFPINEKTVEYLNKGIEAMGHFWSKENRDIATNFFSKSLTETPNYPPALYNLAILYLFENKRSDFERSLSLLRGSLPIAQSKLLEATSDYLLENYGAALENIGAVLAQTPDHAEARSLEILCLYFLNRRPEALEKAKTFVKQQNKDPMSHRLLAKIYASLGNEPFAKFILQRTRSNFPKDLAVQSELAVLMSTIGEKTLQARLIQDASADNQPENLARLSKLNFDIDEIQSAVQIAKDAVNLGGRFHPEIVYNLKLYQEALGVKN